MGGYSVEGAYLLAVNVKVLQLAEARESLSEETSVNLLIDILHESRDQMFISRARQGLWSGLLLAVISAGSLPASGIVR